MCVLGGIPAIREVEGRARSETRLGRLRSQSNLRVDLGDVHTEESRVGNPPLVLAHRVDRVHGVVLNGAPMFVIIPLWGRLHIRRRAS